MYLSLKNKLIIIITLISGLSLLIGASFFFWQNISFMKNHLIKEAKITARLTGNYCVSCLIMDDKIAGEKTLHSLTFNADISQVALYNNKKEIFAQMAKNVESDLPDTLYSEQKVFFKNKSLHVFQPIHSLGRNLGTLYFEFSTEQIDRQIYQYVYTVVVILGLLFLLILFLAVLLQKVILQPIENLTKTTQLITENHDYSVRVKNNYQAELGALYNHFNIMLDQIHLRQKKLDQTMLSLRDSEERYRKVVELSPSAILIHRDDKIVYANSKAIQWSESGVGNQLIGKNIFDYIDPGSMNKIRERIKLMQAGKTDLPSFEEKFSLPDGNFIDTRITSIPFYYQNKLNILTIAEDLSEQKKAEQALRQSEQHFRDIFEQSNDAMYILQGERFILVNPQFIKLFGYNKDEIYSADFNPMDIVAEENKAFILERRKQSLQKKFVPRAYSFKGKTKTGAIVEVEVNLSKLSWDGEDAILGIVRDVTEQRALAEQLRQTHKMEAIGVLAGGVAHDFNNLLTVISGHVELSLLKVKNDRTLLRHLTEIEKAGKRAQDLTRQLLAFSRKQVVELKSLDINYIIQDMHKMLIRLIGEDIRLELALANKIAPLKADRGQLDQIILNLVVNAADAINAREGKGVKRRITIETSNVFLEDQAMDFPALENAGLHVMLAVSDTGIGMDEEIKSKIFEPFFTTKAVGKGTGLGMSTIYGIVKQNGGQIHIYSENNIGTTIKIYWPVEKTEPANLSADQAYEKKTMLGGDERILFVEDEQSVREFAVSALRDLGYKIYQAENADQALKLVNEDKINFDILVTDLIMPGMSGKELAEKLQESKQDLKAIYTSGYTDGKLDNKGMLIKGVHFITKPYSVKALSQKIRQVLDKKET